MEKILLAMDGYHQNTYAIDFACYLSKLTHSRLTGVFLEGGADGDGPAARLAEAETARWAELETARRPELEMARLAEAETARWAELETARLAEPETARRPELEMARLAEPETARRPELEMAGEEFGNACVADPVLQHVRRFREACLCRGVVARVHRDRGVPVADILLESRFSDLIIVDPETNFRKADKEFPGRFIRDVLLAAECPIVVSPYRFDTLNEVIFAYNGTSSSVFAIKQFTYLFPEFHDNKAIVVNVRNSEEASIEEQFKMKEWLSAHYDDVEFVVLKGEASDELFGYLLERKDAIVVLGAYGRGIMSRFLKPSHASLLLRTINLPIFIAHR